jgi:hypothetical protein
MRLARLVFVIAALASAGCREQVKEWLQTPAPPPPPGFQRTDPPPQPTEVAPQQEPEDASPL